MHPGITGSLAKMMKFEHEGNYMSCLILRGPSASLSGFSGELAALDSARHAYNGVDGEERTKRNRDWAVLSIWESTQKKPTMIYVQTHQLQEIPNRLKGRSHRPPIAVMARSQTEKRGIDKGEFGCKFARFWKAAQSRPEKSNQSRESRARH